MQKLEAKAHLVRKATLDDLLAFTKIVFAQSIPGWVGGPFIDNVIRRLEMHTHTMTVEARGHLKSTRFYIKLLHMLMVGDSVKDPHFYFSYNEDLAVSHLKNIKAAIDRNWMFQFYAYDLAPRSSSRIDYINRYTGANFRIEPVGLLGGVRGRHTDGISVVDDPFRDEANKIDAKNVKKINNIIREAVLSVPNPVPGHEIHITGTAQTRDDIYFDKNFDMANGGRYHVSVTPACSEADLSKDIVWPERWSAEELKLRRLELGQASFKQEYLCVPAYDTNPFLDEDLIEAATDNGLVESKEPIPEHGVEVVAAYDPARNRHSAHGTIWRVDYDGPIQTWTQLRSRFWDRVKYTSQLAWWRWAIKHYRIGKVLVDNTRDTFTVLEKGEADKIPHQMELVKVTKALKGEWAHALDISLTRSADPTGDRRVRLLPDPRQRVHLLSVDADKLEAIETRDGDGKIGHGDAFWSNAMAMSIIPPPAEPTTPAAAASDLVTKSDMEESGYGL